MHACMYVCTFVCMYVCISICVCMYECMYILLYIRTNACIFQYLTCIYCYGICCSYLASSTHQTHSQVRKTLVMPRRSKLSPSTTSPTSARQRTGSRPGALSYRGWWRVWEVRAWWYRAWSRWRRQPFRRTWRPGSGWGIRSTSRAADREPGATECGPVRGCRQKCPVQNS